MIPQMWLLVAEVCIAGEFFQVGSGANIADGTSRGHV